MMTNFTKFTQDISSQLSKIEKKQNGIFFTPKTYREQVFQFLSDLCLKPKSVLEPSFGSGEFLNDVLNTFEDADVIHGVELNIMMHEKVQEEYGKASNLQLFNLNFLDFSDEHKYDLIIGNPPYVVIKQEYPDKKEYFKDISCGRPNLYCWFIYKCINMLNDGGVLAFVIPNSIMNTSYYDPLRKFIVKKCEVLNIIEFHKQKTDFHDTEQATIGLILRRAENVVNKRFVVEYKSRLFFNKDYEFIQQQLVAYPSLSDLNFGVRTGTVVWNQHKDNMVKKEQLTDYDDSRPLIFTSNIKNGNLVEFVGKNGKEQYFSLKKTNSKSFKTLFRAPVILMNRGYGNTVYNPEMILIDKDVWGYDEFYVENHLNVIYPMDDSAKKIVFKVYDFLKSDKNKEFIEKYCGNGALSKSEIETILPILI